MARALMMYCSSFPNLKQSQGFSLVEIAMGLVIIAIFISSFVTPIRTLYDNAKRTDTDKMLDQIHDAIIGFALNNNGRLPCPATLISHGQEALTGSRCAQEHGFVPGVSLGLQGNFNSNQLLQDPWGNAYRYSYSLSASYQICNQDGCPSANTILSNNISVVILSTGKDGALTTVSAAQLENIDGDNQFVKQSPIDDPATAYDDHIRWISPNILALYLFR